MVHLFYLAKNHKINTELGIKPTISLKSTHLPFFTKL
jgi:hypothetical protein